LLREAGALSNGGITFFADPHSAPAWMKLNQKMSNFEPDSCVLGYCNSARTSEDLRNDYVQYFIDFIKAYQAQGVPIDAVGVQNEPGSAADYPSGDFSPADQADFMNRLKRGLAKQHPPLTQKVLAESTSPADALEILAKVPMIDGVTYHCYFLGNPNHGQTVLDAVTAFRAAYPGATIHETECSQDANEVWPTTIDILIDHSRSGANSVAGWNLALDPRGGPHSVACSVVRDGQCHDTNTSSIMTAPVVISGPAGSAAASVTREYYEMGHFAKFVRPDAVRIASTELGSVKNVAFENPDGSKVLVVHNTGVTSTTFAVNISDQSHFDVDHLPAGAIATFTW
jgi:glucosylceramidase